MSLNCLGADCVGDLTTLLDPYEAPGPGVLMTPTTLSVDEKAKLAADIAAYDAKEAAAIAAQKAAQPAPAWEPGTEYPADAVVRFNGKTWKALCRTGIYDAKHQTPGTEGCPWYQTFIVGDGTAGTILSAFGELGKAGINAYEVDENKDKANADDASKLQAAVTADVMATLANAMVMTSAASAAKAVGAAKVKADAKAAADASAVPLAESRQDRASAALPASQVDKRVAAIDKALESATTKLQNDPTNVYAQNLVKAWQATSMKAQNKQIVAKGNASALPPPPPPPPESWFVKKTIGVPHWGFLAGGATLAGGLALLVRKLVR